MSRKRAAEVLDNRRLEPVIPFPLVLDAQYYKCWSDCTDKMHDWLPSDVHDVFVANMLAYRVVMQLLCLQNTIKHHASSRVPVWVDLQEGRSGAELAMSLETLANRLKQNMPFDYPWEDIVNGKGPERHFRTMHYESLAPRISIHLDASALQETALFLNQNPEKFNAKEAVALGFPQVLTRMRTECLIPDLSKMFVHDPFQHLDTPLSTKTTYDFACDLLEDMTVWMRGKSAMCCLHDTGTVLDCYCSRFSGPAEPESFTPLQLLTVHLSGVFEYAEEQQKKDLLDKRLFKK